MKKFHITETRFVETNWFYAVQAETLEEALDLVKDGEVDCYDSEQNDHGEDSEYDVDEVD